VKKYIGTSLMIMLSITTVAQNDKQHILFSFGGGLQGLSNHLEEGSPKMGAGGLINASFQYSLYKNWSVAIGMGLQTAKSTATLNFMSSQDAVDSDGDSYEYRTYFSGWEEKQSALFLEIPLGAIYQYPVNRRFEVLTNIGVKIAIPILDKYKVKSGELTTTGYYRQWNVELTDMPQHGFATITEKYNGNINLKTTVALDIEAGSLYRLTDDMDFYFGAYFSYGFSNMIDKNSNPVYQDNGTYNGVLRSKLADRVGLINLGVKVGIRWNLTKWFNTGNKTKFS
jgi:OmpA-OmpF porin, OOP family